LVVAVIAAFLGCWLWDEIAAETKGDFPNGVLCVLTWIVALVAWAVWNFGGGRARL
jgi:hypothetical protein